MHFLMLLIFTQVILNNHLGGSVIIDRATNKHPSHKPSKT